MAIRAHIIGSLKLEGAQYAEELFPTVIVVVGLPAASALHLSGVRFLLRQ
jgi:hypothetical protein